MRGAATAVPLVGLRRGTRFLVLGLIAIAAMAAHAERRFKAVPGVIDRTTERSFIRIPAGFVPELLHPVTQGPLHALAPSLFDADGGITIGPIPKGIPVNLLANLQLLPESDDPLKEPPSYRV